ncbi:MAG: hypothetical protein NVSMB6_03370 [Burkholderiaceae bacterium]
MPQRRANISHPPGKRVLSASCRRAPLPVLTPSAQAGDKPAWSPKTVSNPEHSVGMQQYPCGLYVEHAGMPPPLQANRPSN